MKKKVETQITDLYDGDFVSIWKDKMFVYLSFPTVTVNVPIEDFDPLMNDLRKASDFIRFRKSRNGHESSKSIL